MEAVTFALGLQDVAAVREAVQGGSGEAFAAEHFSPILEGAVGRHYQAVPFVGGGDHVEEQLGSGLAGGDVAQFIEDQQIQPAELLAESQARGDALLWPPTAA